MSGNRDMTYEEVVMSRRSIRGYLDKPVPRALIEEVLTLAMRSPTSMNTQPWHFHVITGEPLDRIRKGNTENILAGVPDSREFRRGEPFAGVHRERQIDVAKQLFGAMGIARDDKERRQDWVLRGFRQFDAPVCVIVTYDRELSGSDDTPFDCGAVTTALVNAAWSRGQLAGDHAEPGSARACGHPRGSGYHEGGGHGLARRGFSGKCRRQRTQERGSSSDIRRLSRKMTCISAALKERLIG